MSCRGKYFPGGSHVGGGGKCSDFDLRLLCRGPRLDHPMGSRIRRRDRRELTPAVTAPEREGRPGAHGGNAVAEVSARGGFMNGTAAVVVSIAKHQHKF